SRSSHSTPFTTYVLDDQDTYPNHSDDDPTNAIEHGSYVERKLVRMALCAGVRAGARFRGRGSGRYKLHATLRRRITPSISDRVVDVGVHSIVAVHPSVTPVAAAASLG
ncbi:MAG TPA: hypothetical protein VGQ65_16740, partial [Thermoanaerobaculia bacterium]|nr:hypothetical protein [Thermoanaerobaculia bacterium]